jgi:hypothetical protein
MKRKLVEKAPDMKTLKNALGLRRQSVSKVPEALKEKRSNRVLKLYI